MLEWLEQLNEEDRSSAIRVAFSQVAATQAGAVVFAVLFEQLYLFRSCPNADATALANFAKGKLLSYFGDDVDTKIVETILRNATHANLKERKKENGE